MSDKVKNGLKAAIEYVKTYGCGCAHEAGFICAECCLSRAISDGLKEIQSLEKEVAMLKEENLKLKNCHNCKFPIFDYGEMDCHKKDKSFYDKYNLLYCDKWEIKK